MPLLVSRTRNGPVRGNSLTAQQRPTYPQISPINYKQELQVFELQVITGGDSAHAGGRFIVDNFPFPTSYPQADSDRWHHVDSGSSRGPAMLIVFDGIGGGNWWRRMPEYSSPILAVG